MKQILFYVSSKSWFNGFHRCEIYSTPNEFLKVLFQVKIPVKGCHPFKLHQHIEIAVRAIISARDRTENRQRLDVQFVKLGAVGADEFYDGVAGHSILDFRFWILNFSASYQRNNNFRRRNDDNLAITPNRNRTPGSLVLGDGFGDPDCYCVVYSSAPNGLFFNGQELTPIEQYPKEWGVESSQNQLLISQPLNWAS